MLFILKPVWIDTDLNEIGENKLVGTANLGGAEYEVYLYLGEPISNFGKMISMYPELIFTENMPDGFSPIKGKPQEDILRKILKQRVRAKITEEVGDTDDLLADLSKRVSLIERLGVIKTYYDLKGEPLPDNYKTIFQKYVDEYVKLYSNGEIKDLVDLGSIDDLFKKLVNRINKITDIVVDEYIKIIEKIEIDNQNNNQEDNQGS